jgi:hypothetical protein
MKEFVHTEWVIEQLEWLTSMLESDRGLQLTPYQMSEATKKYSKNVQGEIENLIEELKQL